MMIYFKGSICGLLSLSVLGLMKVDSQSDVRLPPTVTFPRTVETKYYESSEDYSLACEGEGHPAPRYYWSINGELLQNETKFIKFNSKLGNISVVNPTIRNEGVFQCFAVNKWGTSVSQPTYVRMSRIGTFREDSENIVPMVVKEGNSLSLMCDNRPKSVPSGSYSWYYQSTQQGQIKENKRIAIDKNGTLHLVYTMKNDSRQNNIYACAVTNSELDQIILGSKKRIQVESTNSAIPNSAPHILAAEKYIEDVIGATVKLQCIFGGRPIPVIEWRGLSGNPLGDSSKYGISEYGRVLEITKVTEADEGTYTCIAHNMLGRKSSGVFLNVTSPPMWRRPLISRHAIAGDDISFTCLAREASTERSLADPIWYINGQVLNSTAEQKNGRILSFNSDFTKLTVGKVSRDRDIMGIQCNVSNSIGYIFGDAYLNVLEHTTIISKPESLIIFKYGDVLNFTIRASTDPSRTLTRRWFFNNNTWLPIQSYFVYNEKDGDFYFDTSSLEEAQVELMNGQYICELSHPDQTVNVSFSITLFKSTTDKSTNPVVAGNTNYTVAIIGGISLLVVIMVVIVVLWKQRYQKVDYNLGKKEDKNFNLTPMEELETTELMNDTLNESKLMNVSLNSSKHSLYSTS